MKMVLIQPLTTQQPLVQNEENDDNDPIDEKTELSSEELVRLLDAETLPQNFLDQLHRKFQAKKDFPRESHQKMLTKLLKLDFREEIDIWIDTLVCCADGALRLFFLMLEYVHQIARKELSSDVLEGCLEGFRLLIFGKAYSVDRGSVETARGPIFVAQDSDAEGDDFQYEHLSVKLLLLPGVLSNACQATKFPLPKWCATKSYVCHVLEASTHSTQICKCLAAKVSRRQGGRTISKAWFSSLQNSTDSNPSIWWDAVSSLSRHETAVILTYLLQRGVRCQKCRLVNPAVLNALAMDGDIAASFVQVSILSNIGILEDPEQDIIFVDTVVELLSGIGGDQEVLRSCTLPVSYVWSQPATVGDFAPELQHHLSHFLAKSLDVLKIKDPLSEIFSQSAIGVTFRLNSSILEVRMDAMRIGTLVAESAGLEVNFEELASQGRGTSGNLLTETQSLANSKSDKCLEKVTRHDSDSESDGSLEPYYLDSDEEDLSEVPRPRYLSDCVELLSVSDKEDNAFDSHRIALTVLPSIIESGPIDLPDMSASVARRLLRLENHFSMPEFGQLIRSSLIKLVIADPDRAGGALVHEVFTGLCLSNRGEALCALTDAAFELSGLGDLRRRQDSGGFDVVLETASVAGKRALVDRSLGNNSTLQKERTTRWGKRGLDRGSRTSYKNLFRRVAPIWFYGLIKGFAETKHDASNWGGESGARFLGGLLSTLSAFTECCAIQPGSDSLAKDLVLLASSFVDAEVVELRKAALFAVGTGLESIKDSAVVAELLLDGNVGFERLIGHARTADPDSDCRDIAVVIGGALQRLLPDPVH